MSISNFWRNFLQTQTNKCLQTTINKYYDLEYFQIFFAKKCYIFASTNFHGIFDIPLVFRIQFSTTTTALFFIFLKVQYSSALCTTLCVVTCPYLGHGISKSLHIESHKCSKYDPLNLHNHMTQELYVVVYYLGEYNKLYFRPKKH